MAAVIRWAFIIVLGTLVGIGALSIGAYAIVAVADSIPFHVHAAYAVSAITGVVFIYLLLKART
jgi:hypothetical protein